MLANFFGKSTPANFIVLFLLYLCYFTIALFYRGLSVLSATKELFLFLIIFSIYNFIILKNKLTLNNSYAFLFFVVLLGVFINSVLIDNLFYANLTLLLFFRKVYSLQFSRNLTQKLFNSGLWLGLSFIIEPLTVFFVFVLYVSIYQHMRLNYQTLLTPVLGFFTPNFLYFTYCFWYDLDFGFLNSFLRITEFNFELYQSSNYLLSIAFIGFFTFLFVLIKSIKTFAIINLFRKKWIVVLSHFSFSIIVFLLIPEKSENEFLFLIFPISVILANGIELFQKKWYADVFILFFVVVSILNIFFNQFIF
ncbi:MAG: DUF6427 family protein [Tenacibaculum sp.]